MSMSFASLSSNLFKSIINLAKFAFLSCCWKEPILFYENDGVLQIVARVFVCGSVDRLLVGVVCRVLPFCLVNRNVLV